MIPKGIGRVTKGLPDILEDAENGLSGIVAQWLDHGISLNVPKMDAASFLLTLQCRSRAISSARDPLAEARRCLERHGQTGEGQALRKVIDTLASGNGEFAESKVWLFCTETCAPAKQ